MADEPLTVTDDAELNQTLALLIGRVNRRMRGAGRSLGHGHLSAIATLLKNGPLRLGDLAAREVVSAPSMTRTVTDLTKRGLVERTPDPDDGRSVVVRLTDEGRDTVLAARSERAEMLGSLLSQLTEEERATLRAAVPAFEKLSELRASTVALP